MVDKYGKQLMALRIGGGPRRVAFLFGEHSRELISAETALQMVKYLCHKESKATPAVKERIKAVLAKYRFLIFPNVNPDGRAFVERGRYCHRTNARFVDLNRNWAIHWKPGGPRETAPGAFAFSEPETKLVRDVVAEFAPHVFMSVHSGALGMYTPYAYKKSHSVVSSDKAVSSFLEAGKSKMIEVLKEVNKDYCRCGVGAAAIELNYLCPGNCMDYAFDEMKVPYSFAFEIWDGKTFANGKTISLLESENIIDNMESMEDHDHHHHDEAHNHQEGEMEVESESTTEADEISALSLKETIMSKKPNTANDDSVAPKPKRGHSCLTSFDDFAPSLLEVSSTQTTTSNVLSSMDTTSPPRSQAFPAPTNMNQQQCLVQFNPPSGEQYKQTIHHWSNAFFVVLDKLPHPKTL